MVVFDRQMVSIIDLIRANLESARPLYLKLERLQETDLYQLKITLEDYKTDTCINF